MSKEIQSAPRYLEHEGGTKFYEVIEFWNVAASKFVLAKRWGKVGTVGETMTDVFTTMRACNAAAEKILKSKMGRGYSKSESTIGFHTRNNSFSPADFERLLATHYQSRPFTGLIMDALSLNRIQGMSADTMIIDELSDIVLEEPGPEPDRGESWASW